MMMDSHLPMLDEAGRTPIHNAVINMENNERTSLSCSSLIFNLIVEGWDVDHQDRSGKTALHYAAINRNKNAIVSLLDGGTDVNIVDNSQKSAFNYAIDCYKSSQRSRACQLAVIEMFKHIQKLEFIGLHISTLNKNLCVENSKVLQSSTYWTDINYTMLEQCIESTKYDYLDVKSLTLYDLLSETKLSKMYPYFKEEERQKLDKFSKCTRYEIFYGLVGIFKLQCRKAKIKWLLSEPAVYSLRNLSGYVFPDVYEDIFQHLNVCDMRNLVASSEPPPLINETDVEMLE